MTPYESQKTSHQIADWLLVIGCIGVGISMWAPSWPPYDTIGAALLAGIGLLLGGYRRRWWPIAPMTDRKNEIRLDKRKP